MCSLRLKIGYSILILFSILGMLSLSVLVHEVSHRNDFKDYVKSSEMCLFYVGEELDALGYYSFTYLPGARKDPNVKEIMEWTEFKAYSKMAVVMLIWALGIVLVIEDE